jgi:UDP-galactopyranose mutase
MKMPALKTVTRDEPCDYLANDLEQHYPVKTCDGRYQAVYARYEALAEATPGMSLIGRCGTYSVSRHAPGGEPIAGPCSGVGARGCSTSAGHGVA